MKNRINTTFLTILLALCFNTTNAAVISGPIVNPANNNTYYLLDSANWVDSESEAVSLGGHLVTINDQAENDWVFNTFSTFDNIDRALWIGYNDALTEGVFVWSSGETPAFINWSAGQPDDGNTPAVSEDYVHLLWPGHYDESAWNDFQNLANVNGYVMNGVVEINYTGPDGSVPAPAVVWLLLSGLIGLAGLTKKSA